MAMRGASLCLRFSQISLRRSLALRYASTAASKQAPKLDGYNQNNLSTLSAQPSMVSAYGLHADDMIFPDLDEVGKAAKVPTNDVSDFDDGLRAAKVRKVAQIIDGRKISAEVRADVKQGTEMLLETTGVIPGLAVILVGERKDSKSYVRNKKRMAAEANFHTVDITLPETVSEEDLLNEVHKLNEDEAVHGILIQLPLPKHIDDAKILKAIKLEKDADGFSAQNIGNLCLKGGDEALAFPCTPAGCVEMLRRSNVEISGKNAVVVGRSNIVGMPVAALLQSLDATVTVCHSRTKNIEEVVRSADIVIAAIGRPFFVRGSWLKPGCVVIDVGVNAVDDASKKSGHRLVGDVDYDEAKNVASMISPVPGGVGPMTIAMLLQNTLSLARHSVGLGSWRTPYI